MAYRAWLSDGRRYGTRVSTRSAKIQQEGNGRQIVISGHSQEEFDAKIAEMEQRGEIGAPDLIVCVVNFCSPPRAETWRAVFL